MSKHDFDHAVAMLKVQPPFYGLIMAAMMRADSMNTSRLKSVFPEVYAELEARYNAPGGVLPEDEQ